MFDLGKLRNSCGAIRVQFFFFSSSAACVPPLHDQRCIILQWDTLSSLTAGKRQQCGFSVQVRCISSRNVIKSLGGPKYVVTCILRRNFTFLRVNGIGFSTTYAKPKMIAYGLIWTATWGGAARCFKQKWLTRRPGAVKFKFEAAKELECRWFK